MLAARVPARVALIATFPAARLSYSLNDARTINRLPPLPDAKSQTRLPHAVQDAIRRCGRNSLASPRHRRERGGLFTVRRAAPPATAGAPAGATGELRQSRTDAGLEF